jgi:hypothetical protein
MKEKLLIGVFFIGLLLLAILELKLIWLFDKAVGLPLIVFGSINYFSCWVPSIHHQ